MSFLDYSVSVLTEEQAEAIRANFRCNGGLRFSSACSGSGMAEIAHWQLANWSGEQPLLDFSCEKEPAKQQFLHSVVHRRFGCKNECPSHGPCVFEDLLELQEGVATCAVHGSDCQVARGSSFFVCGFSCKDASRLNNNWTSAGY